VKELRRLLGYASGLGRLYAVIALTSIIGAAVSLATPFVIKVATDWIVAIAAGQAVFSWQYLAGIAAALVGLAIVSLLATDIGGWFGDMMAIRMRRQLSERYYRHLFTLPQHYYDSEVTGTIINRLTRAIAGITQFLQFFSNNLLQMLLTMTITVVILVIYSWPIALLFILLVPVNLYLTARTSGKWQAYEKRINKHFDIASGRFAEVVGQMRLVKSFGTQQREASSFSGRLAKMVSLTGKQSRYWHTMNALRNLAFGVVNAAILCILFWQTAARYISIGDMIMLLTLVQQATFPLRNLSFFVDSYQRAVANSRDYMNALNEAPESDESDQTLEVTAGKVEFDHVNFAYEGDAHVLHDVTFSIESGKKIALVGESGGGKSTIANLLMRLYEPSSGSIVIDGQDISRHSRASVRAAIATVFQDSALFSGTIRENIVYGKPGASDAEVEAAARAANAWAFITDLKKGVDTEIGERGIKLSGGQKQRLSIARALLKDAPILILDEATSALDSKAEHEVQQALDRLMQHRTTLIIAHRLSTIASVDTIVTLKKGRVDEIGTPGELAKSGGIYAELLTLQTSADERTKKQLERYDIAIS